MWRNEQKKFEQYFKRSEDNILKKKSNELIMKIMTDEVVKLKRFFFTGHPVH